LVAASGPRTAAAGGLGQWAERRCEERRCGERRCEERRVKRGHVKNGGRKSEIQVAWWAWLSSP